MHHHNDVSAQPDLTAEILAGDVKSYGLFLDVDGTLLEMAPTPDSVIVPDGLPDLLLRLCKGLDGAVAIITGRKLEDIDNILAPAKLVGSGVHGAELRTTPGGAIDQAAEPMPQDFIDELVELSRHWPRVIAEPKRSGIAIHYRLAPELKSTIEKELTARVARHPNDWVVYPGRKVFEVIPAGFSKGLALKTLAALPIFANRRPVMIGDDAGDEPALAAARELGGFGLKVSGEHFGRSGTDIDGPAGVYKWLSKLADRLES